MKKYLMTGIAALAMCAGFTGCSSHDMEEATPENLAKLEEMKVQQKYEQAFIKAFGQPAANHTWGFGSTKASTRAINVNGNLWEETPEVTAAEKQAVYEYVNRVKSTIPHYTEQAPTGITNYFVSQVWDGKETDNDCYYLNLNQMLEAAKGRTYQNNEKVFGPRLMNEMKFAMSGAGTVNADGTLNGTWEHINNFNGATNTDWGGNTLVLDGGTLNFAYKNSDDSKYHDKWIIIDGQYITDSEGVTHTGKYYVCFDFIGTRPGVKTKFRFQVHPEGNPNDWTDRTASYDEVFTTMTEAAGITVTADDGNQYTVNQEGTQNWRIEGYDGEANMYIPANDIYTDWIVRIVQAQPAEQEQYDGRIMAEDLSIDDDSDFDFNDVVFDWKVVGSDMKIQLRAAGGTLPLNIGGTPSSDLKTITGGIEVHEQFGDNSKKQMINTGVGANGITRSADPFVLTGISSESDIHIYVQKNGYWMEIEAPKGKAAAKINVPCTTQWVDEYVKIEDAYPLFGTYVASARGNTWNTKETKYLDLNLSNNNE